MDRAMLEATLKMAERHARDGDSHVARQLELIAEMLALGVDASRHRVMLGTFEETQRLHIEHVQKLKQELLNAPAALKASVAPPT
jgi:hypothetical protein